MRTGAQGVSSQTLHETIEWVEMHSPIRDPLTRVMPTEYTMETVDT